MAIVLFTGPSASGKSTIARRVGKHFGIPVLGEREILHDLAQRYGFQRTRHWLASVGFQTVLDEALQATVQAIESQQSPRGVILDGSYDSRLLQSLEKRFPQGRLIIVNVTLPQETREERMLLRMQVNREAALQEMKFIDTLKYQAGVENIINQATVTIDNNRPLADVTRELIGQLELQLRDTRATGPERR